jgi:hypothetical protein
LDIGPDEVTDCTSPIATLIRWESVAERLKRAGGVVKIKSNEIHGRKSEVEQESAKR